MDFSIDALISQIKIPASAPTPENTPDSRTQEEQEDLGRQEHKAKIDELVQNRTERKLYASRIFKLVCWWLAVIGLMLFLQGFGGLIGFTLPASVLITAIGSTTATVIGIFLIVTRYLFPVAPKSLKNSN